jgi:hypothetical protein
MEKLIVEGRATRALAKTSRVKKILFVASFSLVFVSMSDKTLIQWKQ